MLNKNAHIFIVGNNDIIDRSVYAYFQAHGFKNAVSSFQIGLNTAIQVSVNHFFSQHRPEYIFLASTRSGGIAANQQCSGEFIYHNTASQNNVIHAAHTFGAKKLLFFASSCVYPAACPQPMKEEHLLAGPLEKTSEPYSIAKIAGIILCQSYRRHYGLNAVVAVPATVYGPPVHNEGEESHVIAALLPRFHAAVTRKSNEVVVWGSGTPRREFLYCDDFVSASMFLMEKYDGDDMINIGCGHDVSIAELAGILTEVSGFSGTITYDRSKPDGARQKLLDSTRITRLGWRARVALKEGIAKIYQWYAANHETE